MASWQAQGFPGLPSNWILLQTLANEMLESIWRYFFKGLVFCNSFCIQLSQAEHCVTLCCQHCGFPAAFQRPSVVGLMTRSVGWVLGTRPVDYIQIVA